MTAIEEEWKSEIDKLEALSTIEKENAKNALEQISIILENNLPSILGQKHPITRYIYYPIPWNCRWMVSFVEAVHIVSRQTNGKKIVDKLKNQSEFDEALFQIYIARCITEGGFTIEFLQEDNKKEITDWKVTDPSTNERFLIELTELSFESLEESDSYLIFEKVTGRIRENCKPNVSPTLFYSGRLLKPFISGPVLGDLFKKIDHTANSARKNGFSELIEDNTINLAFARDDQKQLLKTWTIEKNVRNGVDMEYDVSSSSFVGPRLPVDEVRRIKHKIEKKDRQLDRKSRNALVIRADRLFSPSNIQKYIDYLEELVYDRDYLAALILVGGHVGGLEVNSTIETKGHFYLIKSIDVITKEILILTNKYSNNNWMTSRFSSKIKIAFKNCTTFLF
jgi:hypothetical protein